MLAVISPAKKLDDASPAVTELPYSHPECLKDAEKLVGLLRTKSAEDLQTLMGVSEKIARLNVERYRQWHPPFTTENARQAVLVFRGDVYQNIPVSHYKADDYEFAQAHLRILSGLYGVLRPLDLMQPYRLEMGTRLANDAGKDLYAFWGDRISEALNRAMEEVGTDILVNLASQEYFSAVQPGRLKGRIVTADFKEIKDGKARTIGLMAKRARGMMVDYIISNRLTEPEALKSFDMAGYAFDVEQSTDAHFLFSRPQP